MEARAVDVALVVVSVLITEQFIRVCLSLFHEFTDKFSLLLRELSTSLCAPANEYNPQETLQFLLDRAMEQNKGKFCISSSMPIPYSRVEDDDNGKAT